MKILEIKASIVKTFNNIGKKNGSAPPESGSNTFPVAFEFFVADNLRSIANKRYDVAKAAALAVGVLGDPETYVEGTITNIYEADLFDIAAKKASGTTMLDKTQLANNLAKKGWKADEIQELVDDSSKPRKGATTYEMILKG